MLFKKKKIVPADRDFSKSDLPSSRKKQIWDICKHEWKLLFGISCLFFLLFVPYLGCNFYEEYFFASYDGADRLSYSLAFETTKAFCLLLPFGGLGGMMAVYRRLYMGEGVLFWRDFLHGINWFNLFFGLVYGVINVFLVYLSSISGSFAYAGFFYFLLLGLLCLVLLPLFLLVSMEFPYYSLPNWKGYFGNASRFLVKCYGGLFLFMLYPLGIRLWGFIPGLPLVVYDIVKTFLIFLLPLYVLVLFGFTTAKFDIHLNKEHYPTLYRKGLSDLEEEQK